MISRAIWGIIVAAAFVAGTLATGTFANAVPPENNPGQPFSAITEKLDEILAAIGSSGPTHNERVSVMTNFANGLAGGPAPAATVLLDTTASGTLRDVHVAINLPCAGPGAPIPGGASVLVGVAGGVLTPLISTGTENTGFGAPFGACVYHASSTGNAPGTITDVILSTPSGTLPTTATVTGTYN